LFVPDKRKSPRPFWLSAYSLKPELKDRADRFVKRRTVST
jgi:hypothetical protein